MTSIPLARAVMCCLMFVYIPARFRFAVIGGNLTAQSTGSYRGIGGNIQIPDRPLQALLPFRAPPLERPGELARRLSRLVFIGQIFQQVAISSGTVV